MVAEWMLLTHAIATWFITGVIWFVQVAHYPQFCRVGLDAFPDYHKQHMRLTTFVVAPPMIIEAITAIGLLFIRPVDVSGWQVWTGLALVAVVWISTAALQVPDHNRLARLFSDEVARRLCRTNWIRTIAWSVRALLVLVMLARWVGE